MQIFNGLLKRRRGTGMPSARGSEIKSDDGHAKERYDEKHDRIFGRRESSSQRGKRTFRYIDGKSTQIPNDGEVVAEIGDMKMTMKYHRWGKVRSSTIRE